MTSITFPIDDLDRRILTLFTAEPKLGVLEASRRLQVARGTVQARLDKMESAGVITSWAPTVSPDALGYHVTAFVTCEIEQRAGRESVAQHLLHIPQVLECWTITGTGDLWCRIVAESNAGIQAVVDRMHGDGEILRTATLIGLVEQIPYRTDMLTRPDDA